MPQGVMSDPAVESRALMDDFVEEFGAADTVIGPDPDEELQGVVQRLVEDAINWRQEDLDPDQVKATDYYWGRPFGNEERGRSKVVSTDVRDTVQAILPSLMRVFFGPESVVEFKPRGPEDVPLAEQQTDTVNFVIREDNRGFMVFHSWFKDAMVRRLGVVKWWWEEKEQVVGSKHTGLSELQVAQLVDEPDVDQVEIIGQSVSPEGEPLIDIMVTRRVADGRAQFDVIPSEEFLFSPSSRTHLDTDMVGHVRDVPASDLVAMGIDRDLVDKHKGASDEGNEGLLESERRFDSNDPDYEDQQDDERRLVRFGEIYVRYDHDDDGIAELRLVRVIGDHYELVDHELVDEVPFAVLCPDPEPHTMVGQSTADYVMDIQLIKSAVLRGSLDSLALTLNPRTEVVEGQVNMKDVMNTEIGAVIRARRPGQIREVAHSYVGKEAFPMLEYLDQLKENRTGISKAAAGLDADALQSSTKAAVAATMSGAQQHQELLARIFAETGVAQLYKGLNRLLIKNQDRPRMVRLRNEFVEVDPRSWDANADVSVRLSIGLGGVDEKVGRLMLLLQEQKQQLLSGSPLVSLVEYRRTLAKLTELAGEVPDQFFKPFGEQEAAQMAQAAANAPPREDPQIEAFKQVEAAKLELEREKMLLKNDLDRDKAAMEHEAKLENIRAQYGAKINQVALDARVKQQRAQMDADLRAQVQAAGGN